MKDPLYILDGYGIIYRSYFAFYRNPLYNPEGQNSSAVFGFFNTLFMLFESQKPSCFVVALDSKTPTFRHQAYPQYKATRDKSPDDLKLQIPVIEEILETLGVPTLRLNGYEADDIIATLAFQCKKEKRRCYIISGDKDLLQLIDNEYVSVLKTDKGEVNEFGEQEVKKELGIYPHQVIDYLSLTGDSADNIPGARGIGPKTASALLSKYKDLDTLYGALEELSGNQEIKLAKSRDEVFLSKELIKLKTDLSLDRDSSTLQLETLNTKAAIPLFLKQGIRSLAEKLGGAPEKEEETAVKRGTYYAVTDPKELDHWLDKVRRAKVFAFDLESDNLDAMVAKPVGFSLAVKAEEACYIPLKAAAARCLPEELVKEKLRTILEDPDLKLVGQNFKYDYKVLYRWGITVKNFFFDTMIAAWILENHHTSFSMDNLARRYLNYTPISFKEVVDKGSTFDTVSLDEATVYAAEDADVTLRLYEYFLPRIEAMGTEQLFYDLEMPLSLTLAEMEMAGIRIVPQSLKEYSKELARELAEVEDEIFKLCGKVFNIRSTKQLQQVLFDERKLPAGKKTKNGFSTDIKVLEVLSRMDPVPKLILRHRTLSKLKSTYVDSLPQLINPHTSRIHTSFNQTGTATGRLSSTNPNLQNIPIREKEGRRIRSAFVPEKGNKFLSADYSQIELVVLAHLSGDIHLLQAFKNGEDIHNNTAAMVFSKEPGEVTLEERRIAKTINFGVMYGMSAFRLANELSIPRAQAVQFIDSYFINYARIKSYMEGVIQAAEKDGYVTTLLGHKRLVPNIASKNRTEKMAAERIAINTPIQGTAADIVKKAMLNINSRLKREKLSSKLLLQVHDELIFEVPELELEYMQNLVRQEMENVFKLKVPLRVSLEAGDSWGEFH